MILYINSCVRRESRTDRLAREVIKRLCNKLENKNDSSICDENNRFEVREEEYLTPEQLYNERMHRGSRPVHSNNEDSCSLNCVIERNLSGLNLKPFDRSFLNERDRLLKNVCFDDKMFNYSREFRDADYIVISAPFWNLMFPSLLNIYFENIYNVGIVNSFSDDGKINGLCKAKKLFYVATSGGKFTPDFSYNYIKELAINYFGIKETELVFAEKLDIIGYNPEAILKQTIELLNI